MNPQQFKIASYINNILSQKRKSRYYVHSTFERVVNYTDGDSFISITDSAIPVTPSSVSLNDSNLFNLIRTQSNSEAVFNLSYPILYSQETSLSFLNSDIVDTKIDSLTLPSKIQIEKFVITILSRTRSQKGVIQIFHQKNDDIFSKTFSEILASLKENILDNDPDRFEKGINKLAGLGNGLTPSGDDFIYGLYAAIRTFSFKPEFAKKIEYIIDNGKTVFGDISYNFLKSLRDGHIYIPLKKLFRLLSSNSGCEEAIDDLIKYGLTSGTDILAGVMFALEA